MKDNLLDIIGYTHSLGIIDLVKIVGTDTETEDPCNCRRQICYCDRQN